MVACPQKSGQPIDKVVVDVALGSESVVGRLESHLSFPHFFPGPCIPAAFAAE